MTGDDFPAGKGKLKRKNMVPNMKRAARIKRGAAVLLMTVFMAAQFMPATVFAISEEPELECVSAALIDANTGTILYGKNIDKKKSPASLTKLLTAIVVLDNCKDLSEEVTVDPAATGITGNNMALQSGEKFSVKELMECMLVYSANDAAVALAIHISGSEEAFLEAMNKKARELGCEDSSFISVNGLTNSGDHYVTARDMTYIAKAAMDQDFIRKIVKKEEITVEATNKSEKRTFENTNRMLYDRKTEIEVYGEKRCPKYKGTIGVKTGLVSSSGYCLVAAVSRDSGEFMTVILDTPDDEARYEDSIELLEYGYSKWYSEKLLAPGETADKVRVKGGHKTKVDGIVPLGAYVTLPKEADAGLADYQVEIDEDVTAPVSKGTKVGTVILYEGDEKVGETDVVIAESVEEGWGPWTLLGISDLTMIVVAAVVLILIVAFIVMNVRAKKKERERRRRKEAERIRREREEARKAEAKRRRDWPF